MTSTNTSSVVGRSSMRWTQSLRLWTNNPQPVRPPRLQRTIRSSILTAFNLLFWDQILRAVRTRSSRLPRRRWLPGNGQCTQSAIAQITSPSAGPSSLAGWLRRNPRRIHTFRCWPHAVRCAHHAGWRHFDSFRPLRLLLPRGPHRQRRSHPSALCDAHNFDPPLSLSPTQLCA